MLMYICVVAVNKITPANSKIPQATTLSKANTLNSHHMDSQAPLVNTLRVIKIPTLPTTTIRTLPAITQIYQRASVD